MLIHLTRECLWVRIILVEPHLRVLYHSALNVEPPITHKNNYCLASSRVQQGAGAAEDLTTRAGFGLGDVYLSEVVLFF